jgi:hypothetical protein
MTTYEYGRIANLANSLSSAGIDPEITMQIMQDGENIFKTTSPEKKADWMRSAMQRMDLLLDPQTRHAVREACACCLGGKRLDMSKAIAKNHNTLAERIRAANETRIVFGHSVTREGEKVLVSFAPQGLVEYRCVCLPKANGPLPVTYCYCCGGHVKHHLQIALGQKLGLEVRSSALASGGTQPCTFLFSLVPG